MIATAHGWMRAAAKYRKGIALRQGGSAMINTALGIGYCAAVVGFLVYGIFATARYDRMKAEAAARKLKS